MRTLCLAAILFTLFAAWAEAEDEELLHLRAAIHMASTVSEGDLSYRAIVRTAQENDISVLAVTDRCQMKWEYGFWPLRRIIRKTVEHPSVFTYGVERYLEDIDHLQKEFPEMVILPGVESAPFYCWHGSPFGDNFTMYGWHKHMLSLGLGDPADYYNLPVVGNPQALRTEVSPVLLWPLLPLAIGILMLKKREFNYRDEKGNRLGPYSRNWQTAGIVIALVSLVFLFNNRPFQAVKFDQYRGDAGVDPYQNYIDYVSKKGGLTFWAHPEAKNVSSWQNVKFVTDEHAADLIAVSGYTGYSIFYEGYKKIGTPGGIWDDLLTDYCRKRRERPIWAIGGLAFEEGDLGKRMREMQTVILAPERTNTAVMGSLKKGRFYVAKGTHSSNFRLDDFSVTDELNASMRGIMGDTVKVVGDPIVRMGCRFKNTQHNVEVTIIREGVPVRSYTARTPFQEDYRDDSIPKGKTYYRAEIKAGGLHVVTNPVFVERD